MIRHGQSEDNIARVFGTYKSSLSQKGRKEIEKTKDILKDFEFKQVYYSPFKRAVETYNILELEGTEEKRIGEYDFGIFAGLDHKAIEEKYPDEYKEWIVNPREYIIKEGESLQIVFDRVVEFLEEIIKKNESVVLITHAGIIRLAFCWVLDNINNFLKFKVSNGSINIISVDKENFKTIERSNYKP